MTERLTILLGDAAVELAKLPAESVQCCVTSPPYFGLRSYLPKEHPFKALEIGTEKTPKEYVEKLVAVFREVKRVLKSDGTLWLNLGDTYAGGGNGGGGSFAKDGIRCAEQGTDKNKATRFGKRAAVDGLKPKDLIGIPWMVAFAVREDGWWLRSSMPWLKRNTMPESVTDRPASSIENMFLLSKSQQYLYDHKAVAVPASESYKTDGRWESGPTDKNAKLGYEEAGTRNPKATHKVFNGERRETRNRRNGDWFFESWQGLYSESEIPLAFVVNPCGYSGAHFATFPPELIKPCILAGSRAGDVVLDPFGGSGTTAEVALEYGRKAVLVELNAEFGPLIEGRTAKTPGLALA